MFSIILFSKWLESLEIFKKKEFKIFLLLVLNNFKRSIFVLAKNFWWLFLLLFLNNFFMPNVLGLNNLSFYFFTLINLFLIFLSFLVIRPSVEAKDIFYFLSYLNRFWGFLIILMLIFWFPIFPTVSLTNLFFLDSENNFKSLLFSFLNCFKFIFYYSPVCLILGLIKILFNFLIVFLFLKLFNNYILFNLFYLFLFLIWLLSLSTISIYYVKMKHKDFNLFFK